MNQLRKCGFLYSGILFSHKEDWNFVLRYKPNTKYIKNIFPKVRLLKETMGGGKEGKNDSE
jgi:hypothetical protein